MTIVRMLAVLALFLPLVAAPVQAEEETFTSLFNGQDTSGWEVVGGPAESWSVQDGILATNGEGGGWLSTDREYGDFELRLEFKVPEDGNSGVFIRAPREGAPWIDGLEIQLLDDYAEIHANLEPYQYCGSVYGIAAAHPRLSKPAGEWQSISIRCQGSKVHIKLNGETIVDDDLAEHQDKAEKIPGVNRPSGYIGLQNHGKPTEFRNIEIAELE